MRTNYREHLDAFSRDLIEMCQNVRTLMDNATVALLTQSLDHAEDALSFSDGLDVIRQRCETRSMQLLALESPVASDLRQVVSSIYIVEDFERMGALATHIARLARLRHPHPVLPEPMVVLVEELVRLAHELGSQTEDLLYAPDADAAVGLRNADDEVDTMASYILNVVTNRHWEHSTREAVDLALLCRYFERYSDHCVNVAARTVFLVTGMKPEAYLEHRRSGDSFDMDERFAVIEQRFDRS
ncbi:phosphate signaling complex protein PhoU [Corynebacterium sanguinis]|uniref:Phosphate-specific transport system accessory protein PhoU n=1 Tax=Corynebacterium sanguinis TaxID=2594913 RepID=A0A6C1TYW4_9CORY|nr:phosphate signaling complex protein PhoU [Corynebacterium sanguinis]MCT1426128.1 phosphate signaling complex protein PhoU [Corynebacterium sanguinis]MCT1584960.1 phosphate signaling complex protein PhoU [Corynebacterium sanguinis]MCT1628919.1 phosphate signaling complex protein PhoU [Corynebacterium sanguinis]MCT2023183.1 phosphate signaling complex protein PhoU [Corynebacterium sanguinis]MCT2154632.1 phosphate signaling complex protein PhoU [Corynebacterium sanguinis]